MTVDQSAERPGRGVPLRDTTALLDSLLRRERALLAAAAELPQAREQAMRRLLDAARRMATRTAAEADVETQTLAPHGTPASTDRPQQVRWSKTHQQAKRVADELMELLRTAQSRRAPEAAPHVRMQDSALETDNSPKQGETQKSEPSHKLERAFASILREVAAELQGRDANGYLTGDHYGQ